MEVTAEVAARLLGVSRRTVFRILRDGRLASLTLESIVSYVFKQGYERGRADMLDELRRARRLRRADHRCCREAVQKEREER